CRRCRAARRRHTGLGRRPHRRRRCALSRLRPGRRARAPLPRRALRRLPVALRRLRYPGARGARLRRARRHERGHRDGRGRRRRTGDETHVENLLRRLPEAAQGTLRFAAVTRRPDLVPEGVEPIALATRSQELRMAWALPRLLRRLRPALAHFQYALPLACPCPAVVTVHDLSFERDPTVMRPRERLVFRTVV